MEKELSRHREAFHHLIKKHLIASLEEPAVRLMELLEGYRQEVDNLLIKVNKQGRKQDSIKILQEHIYFRKKCLTLLENWIKERKTTNCGDLLSDFDQEFQKVITQTTRYWYSTQKPERFNPLPADNRVVLLLKFVKRTGFAFYATPVKVANGVRQLLGKPARSPRPWRQRIPVRKLSHWFYGNALTAEYGNLMAQALKDTCLLANECWQVDHDLYETFQSVFEKKQEDGVLLEKAWKEIYDLALQQLKQKALALKNHQLSKLETAIDRIDKLFVSQVEVGGTLEFESISFLEWRRKRNAGKVRTNCSSGIRKRQNTLYVLADDWKFNQEVYILDSNAQKVLLQFKSRLDSRKENVEKAFLKIPAFLQQTKTEIVDEDPEGLRKSLQRLRYNAQRKFNSTLLPEVSNLLLEQNFPMIIDEAEQSLGSELVSMTRERILIADFDAGRAYGDNAMQSISPAELVKFELTGKFSKTMLTLKTSTISRLEKITEELENLGRMVVVNLDSANTLLDEQGQDSPTTSFEDAHAAMDRAHANYQDLARQFETFVQRLQQTLDSAVVQYTGQLAELTDNTKVEQIRFRITKAKALKKSEQLISRSKKVFSESLQKGKSYVRYMRSQWAASMSQLRGRLGIKVFDTQISDEISDFLVSGYLALQKLPYVYRRLFVNEPLKEFTFYFPRKEEKGKLLKAFNKWKEGSFTPVLLVGEKGSGVSTFVQLFVKENMQRKPVVYSVELPKRIIREEELLVVLGQSFRGEPFRQITEFYEYVESREPFVAYVDKLHMLFLRQPGGFFTLKKFFEMISNTSRTIFWICTCGLYASRYLDKSIGLYDYFPAVISMQDLGREDVRNMIMMRHKASGYDLVFKPSHMDVKDRGFVKKNPQQQQEYLKEKYFDSLNRLTKSNIGFALQLWLRSSDKLKDNKIFLNSLEDIDFGFVHSLPQEVIFGLHALVLHENLDVHQLSQVLHISRRQAFLLLMRLADRGIISREPGYYNIHPLLYRQTITLLKDKNLVH